MSAAPDSPIVIPPGHELERVRWLVRRGGEDFGPYGTEDVLASIARREVGLGTEVCDIARQDWEPAGMHGLFREAYAQATAQRAEAKLDREVRSHERTLKAKGVAGGVGRWLILAAVLGALGVGGFTVWRMVRAQPTGALDAVAFQQPPPLPAPPEAKVPRADIAPVAAYRVPVLEERALPKRYDTAGVGAEGTAAGPVTRLDFEGGGAGLDQATLDGIIAKARLKLEGCAGQAAAESESFTGTRVTFVVASGRLKGFTVGQSALSNAPFKACVKRALKRISVPRFDGSERRVTVPLAVMR